MTSTIPCKFYKEGKCRNGFSCKFSHDLQQQQKSATKSEWYQTPVADLVRFVCEEAKESRKMWPLSSFGSHCRYTIPGFENYSYEEIRLAYYKAAAESGDGVAGHEAWLRQLIETNAAHRNQLIEASPQTQQQVAAFVNECLQKEGRSSFKQMTATATGGRGGMNPFGIQTRSSTSVFGQPAASSSSIFASQANPMNKSIFGTPSASMTATNPFSTSAATSSVFPKQSSSVFGGQQMQMEKSSVFGTQQQTPVFGQSSTFGNPISATAAPASTSVFGGVAQNQSVSGGFGGGSSGMSAFGLSIAPGPSVFPSSATPAATNNVFGIVKQQNRSIFSDSQQMESKAATEMPQSAAPDDYLYSKWSDLSETDAAALKLEKWTVFGQIPLVLPPKDLCF